MANLNSWLYGRARAVVMSNMSDFAADVQQRKDLREALVFLPCLSAMSSVQPIMLSPIYVRA